jgi:phenylalanine-4-hydroxylase
VNALASPRLAALHEAAGRASLRATDDAVLQRFSKVFWFSLEFGVTRQRGELRTYGAGLLSSFGEIQAFRDAEMRPFDTKAMSVQDYDITAFQDVLFAGPSFDEVEARLLAYFASI